MAELTRELFYEELTKKQDTLILDKNVLKYDANGALTLSVAGLNKSFVSYIGDDDKTYAERKTARDNICAFGVPELLGTQAAPGPMLMLPNKSTNTKIYLVGTPEIDTENTISTDFSVESGTDTGYFSQGFTSSNKCYAQQGKLYSDGLEVVNLTGTQTVKNKTFDNTNKFSNNNAFTEMTTKSFWSQNSNFVATSSLSNDYVVYPKHFYYFQGSTNITTLGTIGTGTWQGTAIANTYIAGMANKNNSIPYNSSSVDDIANWKQVAKYVADYASGGGGGGGGANAFVELSDAPDSYSGMAGKVVAVNSSATGLVFVDPTASSIDWSNITNIPTNISRFAALSSGSSGQVLTSTGSGLKWSNAGSAVSWGNISGQPTMYAGTNGTRSYISLGSNSSYTSAPYISWDLNHLYYATGSSGNQTLISANLASGISFVNGNMGIWANSGSQYGTGGYVSIYGGYNAGSGVAFNTTTATLIYQSVHSHNNKALLDTISSSAQIHTHPNKPIIDQISGLEQLSTLRIETTPTRFSNNLVTSGGVWAFVQQYITAGTVVGVDVGGVRQPKTADNIVQLPEYNTEFTQYRDCYKGTFDDYDAVANYDWTQITVKDGDYIIVKNVNKMANIRTPRILSLTDTEFKYNECEALAQDYINGSYICPEWTFLTAEIVAELLEQGFSEVLCYTQDYETTSIDMAQIFYKDVWEGTFHTMGFCQHKPYGASVGGTVQSHNNKQGVDWGNMKSYVQAQVSNYCSFSDMEMYVAQQIVEHVLQPINDSY